MKIQIPDGYDPPIPDQQWEREGIYINHYFEDFNVFYVSLKVFGKLVAVTTVYEFAVADNIAEFLCQTEVVERVRRLETDSGTQDDLDYCVEIFQTVRNKYPLPENFERILAS